MIFKHFLRGSLTRILHNNDQRFQTALHQLRIGTQAQRNTINSLLDVLKQKSYQTLLVRHLIWGTKNPLIKLGRDIKPKSDPTRYPYEKYGIFVGVSIDRN